MIPNPPPSQPSTLNPPGSPNPPEMVIQLAPERTPPPEPPQPPEPPDTTEADKRKELIALAQGHLADAYDILQKIVGNQAAPPLDKLSTDILSIMSQAEENDALLSYDIRFSDKNTGEVVHITGHNLLHAFSEQTMLANAPRTFESLLFNTVFSPLQSKVQKYINSFVKNDNLLDSSPPFGSNDVRPRVGEARSDGLFAGA